MEIKNKNVVITGSNRGIGRAFAKMCAQEGAHLILVNRSEQEDLIQEMQKAGAASVRIFPTDLTKKEDIEILIAKLNDVKIDILFNNAGQLTGGVLHEQNMDEIYSLVQVNVTALIQLTHGLLPQMLKRKSGKIINNASVSSYMHFPGATVYSASKAAVAAFTHCLRVELSGSGVSTLLLLTPGVETRMFQDISKKYEKVVDTKSMKSMPVEEYAKILREAILEDLEVLNPKGAQGFGLALARYTPYLFEKLLKKKTKKLNF
jgi:uncharacterized protein